MESTPIPISQDQVRIGQSSFGPINGSLYMLTIELQVTSCNCIAIHIHLFEEKILEIKYHLCHQLSMFLSEWCWWILLRVLRIGWYMIGQSMTWIEKQEKYKKRTTIYLTNWQRKEEQRKKYIKIVGFVWLCVFVCLNISVVCFKECVVGEDLNSHFFAALYFIL